MDKRAKLLHMSGTLTSDNDIFQAVKGPDSDNEDTVSK